MLEPDPYVGSPLYWAELHSANQLPPGEKLIAGALLFDLWAETLCDQIRAEIPDADEARVLALARERVDRCEPMYLREWPFPANCRYRLRLDFPLRRR